MEADQIIDCLTDLIVNIFTMGSSAGVDKIIKLYELNLDSRPRMMRVEIEKSFYSAVFSKSFTGFIEAQYFIDVSLKMISLTLFDLFYKDQKRLQSDFEKSLGVKVKEGSISRGYLMTDLQLKKETINNNIEFFKTKFNEIISLADQLHFFVFKNEKDNHYRYDWYRVLNLSRFEIHAYFQREGVPDEFRPSSDCG